MAKKRKNRGKMRINLLQAAIILVMAIIAARLYQLQIRQHNFYSRMVLSKAKHSSATKGETRRGNICDRGGRELAVSVRLDSVYGVPNRLQQEDRATIRRISNILKLKPGSLQSKLNSRRHFIWIKRKIVPQMGDRLEKLEAQGIGFREESQRYYPDRVLCAQVLGFVGMDNHGLEGVELFYDKLLCKTDQANRNKKITKLLGAKATQLSGSPTDILLTIDKVIQYQTEKQLQRACTATRARAGTAIVMEMKSGEILAMANWPAYNPNSFAEYPPRFRRNRCITDTFEPGSVFKIFLAATALESGRIKPNDIIYCENGVFYIGGKKIRDTHKHGWLSFSDVIRLSSNIGSAKVGLSLKRAKFVQTLKKFGFGSKTSIGLPGEVQGYIPDLKKWTDLTTANISFGQGVLVTPLQIITALCCLANKGYWKRPRILQGVRDEEGKVVKVSDPGPIRRVVSETTCKTLTRILERVVETGTGTEAYIPGYQVAGKTGTAQKVDPVTKHYSHKLFCSSFIGFFPASAPQIAILVSLDEPMKGHLGGVVAAPVFREIAQSIIRYWHIPPVREKLRLAKTGSP